MWSHKHAVDMNIYIIIIETKYDLINKLYIVHSCNIFMAMEIL